MGCMNSKPQDQSEGGEPKRNARNEDFNPKAKYDENKLMPSEGLARQSSEFQIAFQDEHLPLPEYESIRSVDAILQIIRKANAMKLYGIPGAFSIYNERHFDIWIDSNFQLKPDTRNAILFKALFALQVGKATNCNMTFYFTSYPNTKSKSLSENARGCIKSLKKLWESQSWEEAVRLVRHTAILRDTLKIKEWVDDEKNFVEGDTDNDKHVKLLGLAREKMLPFWYGWHQRDLTVKTLSEYHGSAIYAASRQPRSLNSVRFTYERSIKHYLRLLKKAKDDPTAEAYPVTNIFLLGSVMQPTEIVAIKKCQESDGNEIKNAGVAKKLLRQQQRQQQKREVVEGQGTQFQISAVVMTKHMSSAAVAGYREIDNFAEGEDDINDLTTLDESKVLRHLLSPKTLFKVNNCHNQEVDNNLKFTSNDEVYSNMVLTNDDNKVITLPAINQVKDVLGIEDLSTLARAADDSDDEDENPPSNPSAPTALTIQASPDDGNPSSTSAQPAFEKDDAWDI
jgi:hypothetical protein